MRVNIYKNLKQLYSQTTSYIAEAKPDSKIKKIKNILKESKLYEVSNPLINAEEIYNEKITLISDLLKMPANILLSIPYFFLKGTISKIDKENLYYDGCQTCWKKLEKEFDKWYCNKCKQNSIAVVRYTTKLNISDSTGEIEAISFNKESIEILGCEAGTLKGLKKSNLSEFDLIIQKALAKPHLFKVKLDAKPEDNKLPKMQIIEVFPPDSPIIATKKELDII